MTGKRLPRHEKILKDLRRWLYGRINYTRTASQHAVGTHFYYKLQAYDEVLKEIDAILKKEKANEKTDNKKDRRDYRQLPVR